jgi:hypothetical protein
VYRTGPLAERSEQILSKKVCAERVLGAPNYESGPSGVATTQKEHAMNTTHTRTKFLTATVGAVVATMAAPALLFLSAGTAQAFNPQPDPPGFPDPGSQVGSSEETESGHPDPRGQVGFSEETEAGLDGPHVLPPLHH